MVAGKRWSPEETKMAFALYFMVSPTEIDQVGGDVTRFAEAIGRTNRSVAMKLWNIASFDENRILLGRVVLKNASRADGLAWEEYRQRGDEYLEEGLELLNKALRAAPGGPFVRYAAIEYKEGLDRKQSVTQRVNQTYFRNSLLSSYQERCCVTGLSIAKLLAASHLKPWRVSDPKTERLNPSNGLLLNALHDKALDQGLITLDFDCCVVVSPLVEDVSPNSELLLAYSGKQIDLPLFGAPSREFIEYHNDMVFLK